MVTTENGMCIFPGWDAKLEEFKDAELQRNEQICRDFGHDWFRCPDCAARSCLRCGWKP